jgi:DinB family protein
MSVMLRPPDRAEAAEFYRTYIDKVPAGDVRLVLADQAGDTLTLLRSISDERSLFRYAPDKWSIRELVGHLNDAERVFSFRAFWFARELAGPLASFEQDAAVPLAMSNARPWDDLLDEFAAIRAATVALFEGLPDAAWDRRGVASGHPVTVRALAYICAGHVAHHLEILRTRYLL